jgi:hypothetical protein
MMMRVVLGVLRKNLVILNRIEPQTIQIISQSLHELPKTGCKKIPQNYRMKVL